MEGIQHRWRCSALLSEEPEHHGLISRVVVDRRPGSFITERLECLACGRAALIQRHEPKEPK